MIADASVILAAFFPDENQPQAQMLLREHAMGRVRVAAPALLFYELTNAVTLAVRRRRIGETDAQAILESVEGLGIELLPVDWRRTLAMALQFGCTAYDAAYLAAADALGEPLLTNDRRLISTVQGQLDWVRYLGDVRTP